MNVLGTVEGRIFFVLYTHCVALSYPLCFLFTSKLSCRFKLSGAQRHLNFLLGVLFILFRLVNLFVGRSRIQYL